MPRSVKLLCDAYACRSLLRADDARDLRRAFMVEGWWTASDGRCLCPEHARELLKIAS